MADEEPINVRLARIEAHLQANNALLNALLQRAFGGSGGVGGAGGPGLAGGGGGGAAGGGGGAGGLVVGPTSVQIHPPEELVEWLREAQPELIASLTSADAVERASGWERLRTWIVGQAIALPPAVAAGLIASLIPH